MYGLKYLHHSPLSMGLTSIENISKVHTLIILNLPPFQTETTYQEENIKITTLKKFTKYLELVYQIT